RLIRFVLRIARPRPRLHFDLDAAGLLRADARRYARALPLLHLAQRIRIAAIDRHRFRHGDAVLRRRPYRDLLSDHAADRLLDPRAIGGEGRRWRAVADPGDRHT